MKLTVRTIYKATPWRVAAVMLTWGAAMPVVAYMADGWPGVASYFAGMGSVLVVWLAAVWGWIRLAERRERPRR